VGYRPAEEEVPVEDPTENHLMNIVDRPNTVMVRGQGSYLWDQNGRKYLDFLQGWAVNSLGHAPAEVAAALCRQAELLLTPSPSFHNAPQLTLARRLAEYSGLDSVTFGNSGAEATETAIKICRKWGRRQGAGRFEILSADNGFHGRTLAAMAISGKPGWDALFPPNVPGFKKVPYGDVDAVVEAISPQTVAIMVEPIQGEAGAVVPPPRYLATLRTIANDLDLVLVFDEVQTGIGRTGRLFASEHESVRPDVMTLGKGLAGGVPFSAVLASSRVNCLEPGDHGGTFSGNPLCAAVALAVLDVVSDPAFLRTVRQRAERLTDGLQTVARAFGGAVRGRGLLQALVLETETAARVRDACFVRGLLVNAARPNVLRFMPQLRVTDDEILEMLNILEGAMTEVRRLVA
jgi:acetylornithine/N-succinyldiaminopimelate aminotransferase